MLRTTCTVWRPSKILVRYSFVARGASEWIYCQTFGCRWFDWGKRRNHSFYLKSIQFPKSWLWQLTFLVPMSAALLFERVSILTIKTSIFHVLAIKFLHFLLSFLETANLLLTQMLLQAVLDSTSNTLLLCSHCFRNEILPRRLESD